MDSRRPYRRTTEAERVEIISMRRTGETFQRIADELNIIVETVKKVFAKWQQYHVINDRPKCGRPQKLNERSRRHLVRMMQNDNVRTSTQLAIVSSRQFNEPISAQTARNILHKEGVHARHTIPKPLLTRGHKKERLEFALRHAHWSVDNWKQVVFSDESLITAYPINSRSIVWTKGTKGLNPKLVVPAVQAGGSKIMVWGCISKHGFHDLALLEGSVDSEAYIATLSNHLLPVISTYFRNEDVVFQQDGAKIHTSHTTTEFLNENNITVLEWPPHSPDVNIIEHVWNYLKTEIHKLPPATNANMLWSNTTKVMPFMWSHEMTKKIRNLYESMPHRIQAIIDARGGNTEY